MLSQMVQLLLEVLAGLLVFLLLARLHLQWLRVPLRDALGQFLGAATDWIVRPARRLLPTLAEFDLAALAAAWLTQALALWALYALRGGEFGSAPGVAVLVLGVAALLDLARYSLYLLMFAVLVQAVLSWINPYSPLAPALHRVTRPFLDPIRRRLPLLGGVDLSALVLLVALQILLIPLAHLRAPVGGVF